MKTTLWVACCATLLVPNAASDAASPAANVPVAEHQANIVQGKRLFEHQWTSGNPRLGSDGLGPLFNASSCVGCHHQGGAGGGGDARFNAKTIGIEKMRIDGGRVTPDVLATMITSLHPGFRLSDGTIINTCAISHFGGTSAYDSSRTKLIEMLPAKFADEGGLKNAAEVRLANAYPIQIQNQIGEYTITAQARLYQRNTTALFGAGLLDQVPDRVLKQQVSIQSKHPEISGRPSTLRDGRYGKFGWRANLASLAEFTDQACANEVGLKTKRRPQPTDPTDPNYRNPSVDISDEQVLAMRDYLAALPVPTRRIPEDADDRQVVLQGEQLFASVGCAVCHVPDLGPAKGAYTDLLLHEMGSGLMDLNHAEPYIRKATIETSPRLSETRRISGQGTGLETSMGAYYGPSTEIQSETLEQAMSVDFTPAASGAGNGRGTRGYSPYQRSSRSRPGTPVSSRNLAGGLSFEAPDYPSQMVLLAPRSTDKIHETSETKNLERINIGGVASRESNMRISRDLLGEFEDTTTTSVWLDKYLRLRFEPTRFNEEWRTPPLWGVADSAPYMHDGRAETLLEAITLHGGESAATRDRFLSLPKPGRDAIIAFLETLVAPAPQPLTATTIEHSSSDTQTR
ncbi:di-heme oxidoredictase family protein [Roseiconus lacunae]|uniref:Di-heme oxidoredictase family protein n=1 Tax=Roseiconus lacunae TaxID=2605694 RepID=A0ABT7PPU6_9BACT|nr:di-heme oxidoredictase family protein [Roseiconus lacunae]MDM4018519.1 di-heme oxidoredictase family protein [Roseiconus lacunae]